MSLYTIARELCILVNELEAVSKQLPRGLKTLGLSRAKVDASQLADELSRLTGLRSLALSLHHALDVAKLKGVFIVVLLISLN